MIQHIAVITGYLASLLLAISLMMNDNLKFRWVNGLGCIAFVIYGFMIAAYPIVFTNSFLLIINLYYLFKIYRTTENFEVIEFSNDEKLVQKFIEFHEKEIQKYFPDFKDKFQYDIELAVLSELSIVAILIANFKEDKNVVISANYIIPKYRDFKMEKMILKMQNQYLSSKGVKSVLYETIGNRSFENFLKKSGFKLIRESESQKFILNF